jgi:hypothetical protein
MGADAGVSAKGIRVNVEAGEILIIETALQESLKLQCASDGATLAAIDTESLAASGIIAQPSTQPVNQDD